MRWQCWCRMSAISIRSMHAVVPLVAGTRPMRFPMSVIWRLKWSCRKSPHSRQVLRRYAVLIESEPCASQEFVANRSGQDRLARVRIGAALRAGNHPPIRRANDPSASPASSPAKAPHPDADRDSGSASSLLPVPFRGPAPAASRPCAARPADAGSRCHPSPR